MLSSIVATAVVQTIVRIVVPVIVTLERSSFIIVLPTAIVGVKTAASAPKFINTKLCKVTVLTYLLSSYCLLCSSL